MAIDLAPRAVFEQYSLYFPCYQELDLRRPVRQYCVVSHAFLDFGDFAICGAEPRIPRAFAGPEIGDRWNRGCRADFDRPVSNADFSISGILGGVRRDRFALSVRSVCIRAATRRQNAKAAERRCGSARASGFFARRPRADAGSDQAVLLFLLGPGQRKIPRELRDGQVGRRAAFGDGVDDAGRQIGERR